MYHSETAATRKRLMQMKPGFLLFCLQDRSLCGIQFHIRMLGLRRRLFSKRMRFFFHYVMHPTQVVEVGQNTSCRLDRMTQCFLKSLSVHREPWPSAIMWQIYFQSYLNLFSAGSSVQDNLKRYIDLKT